MNNKTKGKRKISKNLIRTLIFLGLVIVLTAVCSNLFTFDDDKQSQNILKQFYSQDQNTVDVIYFGSSATQRAFIEPKAYHNEGVAGFTLATGTQPFFLTKYLMQETLKYQHPKVFIVEFRGICKQSDGLSDVAVRRVIDNMKPSMTKFHAIRAVTKFASIGDNNVDTSGLSYYFPLLKYHSRWNPSKTPEHDGVSYYKGYPMDSFVFKVKKIEPFPDTEENIPIAPEMEQALTDLLDYCDTIDTKVLFVNAPYRASEEGMRKLNYARSIITSRGYECLNFIPEQERDALGLDDRTCYYDNAHLNYYGAPKYTLFLSAYIKDHYGVPDRREDTRYSSWERAYQELSEDVENNYSEKLSKMEKKIRKIESGDK